MTVVADTRRDVDVTAGPSPAGTDPGTGWPPRYVSLGALLFVVANAVAFFVLRPGVNDLWAARARASAARSGVDLTYWFSWFGGSTPGNYSLLTPNLTAVIGVETLCALSAVAIVPLCALLVRGTRHPDAAVVVAALIVVVNLWSGRVPFLFGAVLGLLALLAFRAKRTVVAALLVVLAIFASPVAGAFVAMGLSGVVIVERTKDYRRIGVAILAVVAVCLGVVALVFGTPGPEPLSFGVALGTIGLLLLMSFARPDDDLRLTIWLAITATVLLFLIPNGMGANFTRFVRYCLPVAVVATTRLRLRTVLVLIVPVLVVGAIATVQDLRDASQPVSTAAYYRSLAARLDRLPGLANYRVEVVDHGAHAGYETLLAHAQLARGWETQTDVEYNSVLDRPGLSATEYKVWLDNNAVGYVAMPRAHLHPYPEYRLVHRHAPDYLTRIWSDPDWVLYRVQVANPIAGRPASVLSFDQSQLVVRVPCTCSVSLRVRYSRYLEATRVTPSGDPADSPPVHAVVGDDGFTWSRLTTTRPGRYVLSGSLSGGLLH